jgi:hypothetical protein
MITLILQFVASNWRIVLIGALVTTNMMTFQLWRHSANSFNEYRTNAELISEAQAKHAAEVVTEQERITKETTDGWKAAVDYLHAHPQRVLSKYCAGGGISLPSAGTDGTGQSSIPASPGTSEIPETFAELEADVSQDVLKLNKLQDWIEAQKAVK